MYGIDQMVSISWLPLQIQDGCITTSPRPWLLQTSEVLVPFSIWGFWLFSSFIFTIFTISMWFNIRISSYAYTIYLICFPKPSLTCSVILYEFFFPRRDWRRRLFKNKVETFCSIIHCAHSTQSGVTHIKIMMVM